MDKLSKEYIEHKEDAIIASLRRRITDSISDARDLLEIAGEKKCDRYFLQLTFEALRQCQQVCIFVLNKKDKINTKEWFDFLSQS
jgi:GTP-binding protein EngB required for normal cell division